MLHLSDFTPIWKGKGIMYILILILCCLDFYIHYYFVKWLKPDLTEKQKAYILSIKSSLTLLLIGIFYNYVYFSSNCNEIDFYNILNDKNTLNFGKLSILYFTAYLIMDIYIGKNEYDKYMNSLSGYIHHSVYIVINIISLYYGIFPIYLLHMMSELPTFILSIGTFDSKYRNDNLFGASFFLTRIVYHIILIYIFRHNNLVFYISLVALILHLYWFYNWFKKYGLGKKDDKKTSNAKKSSKKSTKN